MSQDSLTYSQRRMNRIQELLDQDKQLRKASNELYMVVIGEYEDRAEAGVFELKADAIKFRDRVNEEIGNPSARARLDVIRLYRRGETE